MGSDVGVAGPGLFPSRCASPASGTCVWLSGINGRLTSSTVTLEPGVRYALSYDAIGNTDNTSGVASTLAVTLGPSGAPSSLFNVSVSLPRGDTTTGIVTDHFLPVVSVATPVELIFRASGQPGGNGPVIDNVLLEAPEPATLDLMVLGLLGGAGAGFARRKRRN